MKVPRRKPEKRKDHDDVSTTEEASSEKAVHTQAANRPDSWEEAIRPCLNPNYGSTMWFAPGVPALAFGCPQIRFPVGTVRKILVPEVKIVIPLTFQSLTGVV